MTKFEVIREHEGDKPYLVGDIREADEVDVRHLIGKCLKKMASVTKDKSAKSVQNKAAK